MGQTISTLHIQAGEVLTNRQKRSRDDDDEEEQLPKRFKLRTTTQYIFKSLFLEGMDSNVVVTALDKEWRLHKFYLSQSPYFHAMFNGPWVEANRDAVHITIPDDLITVASLDAVFGSLYSDEIELEPPNLIAVLATATMFLLEDIVGKCAAVMMDTISSENAVLFYEAACRYEMVTVKMFTFEWFKINLMSTYTKQPHLLRDISIELMSALTASHDLFVMQTEFTLYTVLRKWMFLRLHPDYMAEDQMQQTEEEPEEEDIMLNTMHTLIPSVDVFLWTYFASRPTERSFLATAEGQPYVGVFQKLRTQHLTNECMHLRVIAKDNIIPKEWLYQHVHSSWEALLDLDQDRDDFHPQRLDDRQFFENCMRCGFVQLRCGYQIWRWTGFNLGLDLLIVMDSPTLHIRRLHDEGHERVLGLQARRTFMIRTTVTSVNAQRMPIFTQSSEICSLTLGKNEEVPLMVLHENLEHPLFVSINILMVMPQSQTFKEIVPNIEEVASTSTSTTPTSEIEANGAEPIMPIIEDELQPLNEDEFVVLNDDLEVPTP